MKADDEKDLIYTADAAEFARACRYLTLMQQHKIVQLEKFLRALPVEHVNLQALNQWFEQNTLQGSTLHQLLAKELLSQKAVDEKRRRCLGLISKKYQRTLVEQYEPLIVSSMQHADKIFDREKYRKETARRVIMRLSINGERLNINEGVDDIQGLRLFRAGLERAGLTDLDMIDFLQCYLSYGSKWAYEYHAKMLRTIRVETAIETKETRVEFDAQTGSLQVHFLSSIRKFSRIKSLGAKSDQVQSSVHEVPAVMARAMVSYQLRPVKKNSSQFFQGQPLSAEIELCGASLEIYEGNAKNTIIRDLAVHCSKKLRDGNLMHVNDEIVMRHLMRDCLQFDSVDKIITWLIAHKDAFRIVLAVRMNRQVLKAVFRNHELLACLCADPDHMEYLQLLKFWYIHDERMLPTISLLLNRIDLIQSSVVRKKDKEILSSFFRNDRENNELCMFAALHVLLLREKHDISFLMTDNAVLRILEKKGWVISLAVAFEEVAVWLVNSGAILRMKIPPDRLCDLLKAHPRLWDGFEAQQEESVRELPTKLLTSSNLHALVINNGVRQSVEAATLAICKSSTLYYKLCSLKVTHPNDLLRFFTKFFKLFKLNWEKAYTQCETYLLGQCDGATIHRYYECLFAVLPTPEFCVHFNAVVLMEEHQGRSPLARQMAGEVLISLLVKRLHTKGDFSLLWSTLPKIDKISRLLSQEPSLALLIKFPSFRAMLKKFSLRSVVVEFVNCIIEHHSRFDSPDTSFSLIAFSLLEENELTELIFSVTSRQFMFKFLITEPASIEFLNTAIPARLVDMDLIFQHASTQQLVLLLMVFTVRENELTEKLASCNKVLTSCAPDMIQEVQKMVVLQQEELNRLAKLKQFILESAHYLDRFLSSDQNAVMDLACLISYCPNLIKRVDPQSMSTQQGQFYQRAVALVQPPQHEIFQALKRNEGVFTNEFTLQLEELWHQKNYELFNRLLNACILLAFTDTDILNGIKSTPNLLEMVVLRGDLRLVAKMIIIFGKRGGFDPQLDAFFYRLNSHPKLLGDYRPLFNLANDLPIPVAESLDDRAESPPLAVLKSVSDFSSLAPFQLLDLIKRLRSGENIPSEWVSFLRDPTLIFPRIFNSQNRAGIVFQSIPLLVQYYSEYEELRDQYFANYFCAEVFDRAEVGEAIDMLVTQEGLEIVFPEEDTQLSAETSLLLCQLFLLCNDHQLRSFALKEYVNILIQNISLFNSDLKVYHQFVLPRLVATLVILFEKDPAFVENQFVKNHQLVDLLRSSNQAVDDLLCSPLYEASETMARILDSQPIIDPNLLNDSPSSPLSTLSAIRMNVSRSSSSPGSSMRIRPRRCIPKDALGSESDPDPHSASSLSKL